MSTQTQAVVKQEDTSKSVEFIPFGSQDKIKLSIYMVKNLIAVKTRLGKTCSDTDAIKFIAMCQARRLNPFEGDAYLIGYDGKEGPTFSLITAHQAFLKRAEASQEYDGMKSGIIVREDGALRDLEGDFFSEGQEVVGGWATVFFKNRSHPMHKRIRLQRFKKSFGIWLEDSAGMICKCAEADALRSSFPTMLGGLYLREELLQVADAPKPATPIFATISAPGPSGGVSPTPAPNAPPAPSSEQGDPIKELAGKLRAMCNQDGVQEKDLIEFCNAIGIADDGLTTLEQVVAGNDTAYGMVVDNWQEFSTRIKETPQ